MFAGKVDPSMYFVFLNADEIGWVPRPPNLSIAKTSETIKKLAGISKRISNDGYLDYRFAASIHERKHFHDMHFTSILWSRFLAWFHCTSNIFIIINNLNGKKISLPLYTIFGEIRKGLPLDEKENITKICNHVFSIEYDGFLDYFFEVSASLLQFGSLFEWYQKKNLINDSSYGTEYFMKYFQEPVNRFNGNINKAFAFYNFCSWFCNKRNDISLVSSIISHEKNLENAFRKLLLDEGYHEKKLNELVSDLKYLNHYKDNYKSVNSSLVVDLPNILSRLIFYRKNFFQNIDKIITLCSNISDYIKWTISESPSVPLLVDFQRELDSSEEISENYEPSRWILPRKRFFYYNDNLGLQILTRFEIDILLSIQHLSSFIINPFFYTPVGSTLINKEFLGFEFIDERLNATVSGNNLKSSKIRWKFN